jgi:hypothetical protein
LGPTSGSGNGCLTPRNRIKSQKAFTSIMGADDDDVAYHKSVRNTSVVLVVVVAVLVASIGLTLLFDVTPNTFQTKTTVASDYPFTLTLEINTTAASATKGVMIMAWLNGTSTANVTANSNWAFDNSRLVGRICTPSFPVGVGVMQGHYTSDNYSLGTLLRIQQPLYYCPVGQSPPWFYFSSSTSKVLVTLGGNPVFWILRTNVTLSAALTGVSRLSPGVYTAVAADEWGDFVLSNFRVS